MGKFEMLVDMLALCALSWTWAAENEDHDGVFIALHQQIFKYNTENQFLLWASMNKLTSLLHI